MTWLRKTLLLSAAAFSVGVLVGSDLLWLRLVFLALAAWSCCWIWLFWPWPDLPSTEPIDHGPGNVRISLAEDGIVVAVEAGGRGMAIVVGDAEVVALIVGLSRLTYKRRLALRRARQLAAAKPQDN